LNLSTSKIDLIDKIPVLKPAGIINVKILNPRYKQKIMAQKK
jgi:hypothetical protein